MKQTNKTISNAKEIFQRCQQEKLPRTFAEAMILAQELADVSETALPHQLENLIIQLRIDDEINAGFNQFKAGKIRQQRERNKVALTAQCEWASHQWDIYKQMIYRDITDGTFFTLKAKVDDSGTYRCEERQSYYWLTEWDAWKKDACNTYGEDDWFISPAIYDTNAVRRESSQLTHVFSFWADFDYGDAGHKQNTQFQTQDECSDRILGNLYQKNLTPTLWFHTGHGFHAYWCTQENLIGKLSKNQIEQVNEMLYQTAVGGGQHYNEIKSVTTLVRCPLPGTNLKCIDDPKITKLEQLHEAYAVKDILDRLPRLVSSQPKKQVNATKFSANIARIGCMEKVLADKDFMEWIHDSKKLHYFKNDQYHFDSTSAKEAWIMFYLWLCNLESEQILEFFKQHADGDYHLLRTRKTTSARLELIRYNISQKNKLAEQGKCSAKIKKNHIMEANWNDY